MSADRAAVDSPATMRRPRPILSPLLVGRDDLLALAERRIAEAADGHGGLVLLAGEAGVGKTRLLSAIREHAKQAHFKVTEGALAPQDRQVPLASMGDMARSLRDNPDFGTLGADLLALKPEERAREGVFLAFQYPVEIPGVATMNFLRTALNAQRKARGESEYSTPDFLKKVREVAKSLNIPQDMLRRGVNVGFSGGEKKRNEILQMALFEPALCILDEMDSGLDIDALRIAADGVNALRSADRAMVVITHYQRLLNYIIPDFVHVMSKGRVVKSGGKELALELEESGYAQFEDAA